MYVTLRSTSRKDTAEMMTYAFANMTAYAQDACAVSACSDMNNSIILTLDAGILLASIIILLVLTSPLTCRNMTSPSPCLPS